MKKICIAIGSNLGDRKKNCEQAIACLQRHEEINVVSISPWYRSQALTLNQKSQPDYCNGVAIIETTTSPHLLLKQLKEIENELGRKRREEKWTPRIIDLDLLLYDDRIIQEQELIIPHPEMTKRIFVLQPLCDIAPDIMHPVEKKSARELLNMFLETNCAELLQQWGETL